MKLNIAEPESDAVKWRLQAAESVAVARPAWAEVPAALARRVREVSQDLQVIEKATVKLATDWSRSVVVDIDQSLVEQAGEFADSFALRAYDSVQLASAFRVRYIADVDVCFACFDIRLNLAASVLGMQCF